MIKIKIKNWKLALLALFFFSFFIYLGMWQLSRAAQKKRMLNTFAERTHYPPLLAKHLLQQKDWRFYRIRLEGTFDNAHTFLLDNKIFHSRVGYEVYTPFKVKGSALSILIDRGFVPILKSREELPLIREIIGDTQVVGFLNFPPAYVAFGQIHEKKQVTFPLRIEFVNLTALGKLSGYTLYPYIVSLEPSHPAAYPLEWQIVVMPPERHLGYAIQWFALALTLLILFVALNRSRT